MKRYMLVSFIIFVIACLFIFNFFSAKNDIADTYLGLPVNRTYSPRIYDTSTIEGAIKYSDYAFIAKVNGIKKTEYKYDDKLPYTIYDINVEKNISGNLITSNSIELMQYGGLDYDKNSYTFDDDEEYLIDGHYYFFSVQTWGLIEGESIIFDRAIDLGVTLEQDELETYMIDIDEESVSYSIDNTLPLYNKTISKYDVNYNK